MRLLRTCFLLVLLAGRVYPAAGQALIAVAEQNCYESLFPESRRSYKAWIRPVFVKRDTGWAPACDSPPELQLYPLESNRRIPAVRRRPSHDSADFVSACCAGLFRPKAAIRSWTQFPAADSIFEFHDIRRYQVLSIRPQTKRTQHLQPDLLLPEERSELALVMVKRVRQLCRNQGFDTTGLTMSGVFFASGSDTLLATGPASRILRSGNAKLILQPLFLPLHPILAALSPNGRREDSDLMRIFSVVRSDGKPEVFYADMQLLDHADFDGDGSEEYLFFCSRFNHYGYMLLYDDFHRISQYEWAYH